VAAIDSLASFPLLLTGNVTGLKAEFPLYDVVAEDINTSYTSLLFLEKLRK
jgi:hypothetical protein